MGLRSIVFEIFVENNPWFASIAFIYLQKKINRIHNLNLIKIGL